VAANPPVYIVDDEDAVRDSLSFLLNLVPVRVPGALEAPGILRFESEMNFIVLLRLAWEVIDANLTPSLLRSLQGSPSQQNGEDLVPMAITGSRTGATG
jgi:FixJ family two-component response regulator